MDTAKREFENVKKQEVPLEVSAIIDRFLDAITRAKESERTVIRGFVEFGIGYDTNVNSATAENQAAIPPFCVVNRARPSSQIAAQRRGMPPQRLATRSRVTKL